MENIDESRLDQLLLGNTPHKMGTKRKKSDDEAPSGSTAYRKLSDIIPAMLDYGIPKLAIAKMLGCDRSLVYFYANGRKKYCKAVAPKSVTPPNEGLPW